MRGVGREFFERLYQDRVDPWGFAQDDYELARYATLVHHVPAGRYGRVYEPGCAEGVLTERLASRCGHVVATDIAATAVARARARCRHLSNVEISQADLAAEVPSGVFDLVVFSEVGYYFTDAAIGEVLRRLERLVAPGGRLVAAHWIGFSSDHVSGGDDVHAALRRSLTFEHVAHDRVDDERRSGFVLDVWDAPGGTRP